jgi:hypothetical protein
MNDITKDDMKRVAERLDRRAASSREALDNVARELANMEDTSSAHAHELRGRIVQLNRAAEDYELAARLVRLFPEAPETLALVEKERGVVG